MNPWRRYKKFQLGQTGENRVVFLEVKKVARTSDGSRKEITALDKNLQEAVN